MFHLHCDYILPALLNIIFVSSNRIQCLNFVLWSDNEVKKIMCRWFSCTNRWLLHVCVKWTYMCMLWKFTPCFHGIIWLKWGNFFYHFEGALCDQNLVQTHKHPGLPGHRLVMLFIYSFVICIYQLYIYCKFLFIRLFETFRQSAN